MVAEFSRDGVCFQYPENWQLSDDSQESAGECLTLQSPGSGFWMLQGLRTDQSPDRLVAEVLRSMEQDYDSLEANLVRERLGELDAVGYDMQFYCLDFLVCSKVRSFSAGGRKFVVICQAEDREFNEIEPVFLAITTSLLNAVS